MKDFNTVPVSLKTTSGENGEVGFLQEIIDEDGKNHHQFHRNYSLCGRRGDGSTEAVYYVDKDVFHDGDVLVQPDSNTRFTIGATATLTEVLH